MEYDLIQLPGTWYNTTWTEWVHYPDDIVLFLSINKTSSWGSSTTNTIPLLINKSPLGKRQKSNHYWNTSQLHHISLVVAGRGCSKVRCNLCEYPIYRSIFKISLTARMQPAWVSLSTGPCLKFRSLSSVRLFVFEKPCTTVIEASSPYSVPESSTVCLFPFG